MKYLMFENKEYGIVGNLNKDGQEYLILVDENINNIVLTKENGKYIRDVKKEKEILNIINNKSDILYINGSNNLNNKKEINFDEIKNNLLPKFDNLKKILNISFSGEKLTKDVKIKFPTKEELIYIMNRGINFDDNHFACYDSNTNTIFVNEILQYFDDIYTEHIICHELVHLYSTNKVTKLMGIMLKDYSGRAFNEGITELITNFMLQDEVCIDVIDSYQALGLTKILDFITLVKCYFENDSKTLINELLKLGTKNEVAILINSADATYNISNNIDSKNLDNNFINTTQKALSIFYLKKELIDINKNLYSTEDELLDNIIMFKNTIIDSEILEQFNVDSSKYIDIDSTKEDFYELVQILLNEFKNHNLKVEFNNSEQIDELNSYRDLFPKR